MNSQEPTYTSHDYARELQRVAEFLLSRPAFAWSPRPYVYTPIHCWEKEEFLAMARGLGQGKKEFKNEEMSFTTTLGEYGSQIKLYIPRSKICRLVRPAEYECEPFLSDEEAEQLQKLNGAA